MAATSAERQARYMQRLRAGIGPKPVSRPHDRRSRPQRWLDAVGELYACLNGWQAARDAIPESLASGEYAARLDSILEMRSLVEQLDAADLPLGFGRD